MPTPSTHHVSSNEYPQGTRAASGSHLLHFLYALRRRTPVTETQLSIEKSHTNDDGHKRHASVRVLISVFTCTYSSACLDVRNVSANSFHSTHTVLRNWGVETLLGA